MGPQAAAPAPLKAAHNRIDALPFAGELHADVARPRTAFAADEMLMYEIHCLPPSLRHLDLSHNGLATLKRLPLPHLMTLEADNQLDNFDGLSACSTLCGSTSRTTRGHRRAARPLEVVAGAPLAAHRGQPALRL